MNAQELAQHAKRIAIFARNQEGDAALSGFYEACEFLRQYAGEYSTFYRQVSEWGIGRGVSEYIRDIAVSALEAFARYVEYGLHDGVSLKRQVQLDIVSDFLEQAQDMLETADTHPAVAAVIIGAALEEFLRNWVEEANLSLEGQKPSIDSYSSILLREGFITKQDKKDITAWGGIRNHAAHGQWEEVADKSRIRLMLEGVNLFMRRYSTDKVETLVTT